MCSRRHRSHVAGPLDQFAFRKPSAAPSTPQWAGLLDAGEAGDGANIARALAMETADGLTCASLDFQFVVPQQSNIIICNPNRPKMEGTTVFAEFSAVAALCHLLSPSRASRCRPGQTHPDASSRVANSHKVRPTTCQGKVPSIPTIASNSQYPMLTGCYHAETQLHPPERCEK